MENKDCNICASPHTSYMRKRIKCEYCVFEACKECCSTYLLNVVKPGCMSTSCTGEWSREFISDNLTKVFANTKLRKHKSEMLFQEQLSHMMESQLEIEEEKRQRRINLKIRRLNNQINELRHEAYSGAEAKNFHKLINNANCEERELNTTIQLLRRDFARIKNKKNNNSDQNKDEIGQLVKKIKDLLEIKETMFDKIRELDNQYYLHIQQKLNDNPEINKINEEIRMLRTPIQNNIIQNEVVEKKAGFVRKCGDAECRGFLSTRWKCGLCETYTCSECHEHKGVVEHVCDPNNIATAKLLSKDTKGCPTCQTSIYKTDGCDQMWCTQCHTAFSWNTGQIETKIHNPHYYEWRRLHGGLDPENVACDNALHHMIPHMIQQEIQNHKTNDNSTQIDDIVSYIYDVVRSCEHIRRVIIPKIDRRPYQQNQTFAQITNQLRKEYLNKDCDLEQFKSDIESLDRKISKSTEMIQVLNLIITTVTEIVFRFKTSVESVSCDMSIPNEITEIVKYGNQCLVRIGITYATEKTYWFADNLNHRMVKVVREKRITT
jgi:hypothetical protein